jgi:hypothetical protein
LTKIAELRLWLAAAVRKMFQLKAASALAWLEVDTVRPYASDDFYYLEDAFDSTRRMLPTVDPHQDILLVRKSSNKT